MSKTIALAMTGASGAPYGWRLLEQLLAGKCRVYLMLSAAAEVVTRQETSLELPSAFADQERWLQSRYGVGEERLRLFDQRDWFAPVASGSSRIDGMVVCPASGGTLSALATGASDNLIERAGDVALKERWPLIVVPRETPVSAVHLEHMLKLTQLGATVLPASPGFYQRPADVGDLVDFVVARILNCLGLSQDLLAQWGQREGDVKKQ